MEDKPEIILHLISIGFVEIDGKWRDVWGQCDGRYWQGDLRRGNQRISFHIDIVLFNGKQVNESFLLNLN